MTRGIRITLWILSSAAVLWTVGALAMAGTMMDGTCPMCGMGMGGGDMMGQGAAGPQGMIPDGGVGGANGMMGGMMWMMLGMGLTWLVMLGLDAVFVYLVLTTMRQRRSTSAPSAA